MNFSTVEITSKKVRGNNRDFPTIEEKRPEKEVFLEKLVVGGNYVWCLAIITIFKELGGANR